MHLCFVKQALALLYAQEVLSIFMQRIVMQELRQIWHLIEYLYCDGIAWMPNTNCNQNLNIECLYQI